MEIEGEHGTEGGETDRQLLDGKGIHPGTQMLATHIYQKNPDGPVGNELDLSCCCCSFGTLSLFHRQF